MWTSKNNRPEKLRFSTESNWDNKTSLKPSKLCCDKDCATLNKVCANFILINLDNDPIFFKTNDTFISSLKKVKILKFTISWSQNTIYWIKQKKTQDNQTTVKLL